MSLLVLTGQRYNVLPYIEEVAVSDEDSEFPKENLHSGRPSRKFKAGSNSADRYVRWKANKALNGSFETSTLDGFTSSLTGTASAVQTTTGGEFDATDGGTKAAKLTGGSGVAELYRDYTLRSGRRIQINAMLRGNTTSTARLRVLNRNTGKYLHSDGTWGASADLFTESGTSFVAKTLNAQLEDYLTCQEGEVTIRIICRVEEASFGCFDAIQIIPAINFLGIFGSNLSKVVIPTWQYDEDSAFGSPTTIATPTLYRPAFYSYQSSPVYKLHQRLLISGTNLATPIVGELVVGYAETLRRDQSLGMEMTYEKNRSKSESQGGDVFVMSNQSFSRLTLGLKFTMPVAADLEEARQEVAFRSPDEGNPFVVVPDSNRHEAIHGRRESNRWKVTRQFKNFYDSNDLVIREDPHPRI